MLKRALQAKFPDFWDIFYRHGGPLLGLIALAVPTAIALGVFVSTTAKLLVFYLDYNIPYSYLFVITPAPAMTAVFSLLGFVALFATSLSLYRTQPKLLQSLFLQRYFKQIESCYRGKIPSLKEENNILARVGASTWIFSTLSLLPLSAYLIVFTSALLFLGWIFRVSGVPYFSFALVAFAPPSLALAIFVIRRKTFQVEMEAFQAHYRALGIETKFRYHHPCGVERLPKLSSHEKNSAYFQFFELSQKHLGRTVFQNFSFTLPVHTPLAVCSPDQFRKSVFLSLLERREDPELGKIRLAGKDLREYELQSRINHIRVAKQGTVFLPTTISDNLTILCEQERSEQELRRAITFAGLEKLVPNGKLALNKQNFLAPSALDSFRILIARHYLLEDAQIFYFIDPFANLLPEEVPVATTLLEKLAQERQIVFFEPALATDINDNTQVFFFPVDRNPVLSTARALKLAQKQFSHWSSSKNHEKHIEIQFEKEGGESITLRWQLLEGRLPELWWKNLWQTLFNKELNFEQRFFGWRTSPVYQEKRVGFLNRAIEVINSHYQDRYQIPQLAHLGMQQDDLNRIHHHFEKLIGQSWNPSPLLKDIPRLVHDSIRALNDLVHDYEYSMRLQNPKHGHRVVSGFQLRTIPQSQIPIPDDCFSDFTYENQPGDLVTDYCQLGKTWSEVLDDQDQHISPENISPLRFYSSSFICNFHHLPKTEADQLRARVKLLLERLRAEGKAVDPKDPKNALGHIPLARLLIEESNALPSQEEFSRFQQIVKITLTDRQQRLEADLPKHVPFYENLNG